MTRHILFLLPSLTLAFLHTASMDAAGQQPFRERPDMERAYSEWKGAHLAEDFNRWERATSSSRRASLQNEIVSQKKPFPQSLFALPFIPPEIVQLSFLEGQKRGGMAQLFYFGKVDLGLDAETIPANLLSLRFVNEAGAWKFDSMSFFNLEGNPAARAELAAGKTSFLRAAEFELPAAAPVVPALVDPPFYVGRLQVMSIGYKTRAMINGNYIGETENDNTRHLIIGGLNDGANDLSLSIEPAELEEGAKREIYVAAFAEVEGYEEPPIIFRWAPEEGEKIDPVLTTKIWANAVTFRNGGKGR